MSRKDEIDPTAERALDQWLAMVLNGEEPTEPSIFEFQLPSSEAADLLVERFADFVEEDALEVIRTLLLPSGSLGADDCHLDWLKRGGWRGAPTDAEIADSPVALDLRLHEFDRRLLTWADDRRAPPPWEGITWVLDLLPGFPQAAIDAASAYVLAHAQQLPDGRYAGMVDALALIRSRFIGLPGEALSGRRRLLLERSPRDFERIVERYLTALGFDTQLTEPRHDGGRDVIAERQHPPPVQIVHAECKNWESRVGRPYVQRLLGVVEGAKAPTGLLVGTSGFTRPAIAFARENPRITLLGGDDLVLELNRVLGTDWPARIDRLLVESESHSG